MTQDLAAVRDRLVEKNVPTDVINRSLSYIDNALRDEAKKAPDKAKPVTANNEDQFYSLIYKWFNMGLALDGTNVVITGNNMAMVTFNGYKNKVLATYPETQFDIQLVRENDTFSFSKNSGKVSYSHELSDPFNQNSSKIVGAYCVIKNNRGEYLETLGSEDFTKMKNASKQKYLWGEWESEFWLKSVIKRACKRHFFDVVEEIDKNDNEDYGIGEENRPIDDDLQDRIFDAVADVMGAKDLVELNDLFQKTKLMKNKDVVAAYKQRRADIEAGVETSDADS